jgi:hypothetical protein
MLKRKVFNKNLQILINFIFLLFYKIKINLSNDVYKIFEGKRVVLILPGEKSNEQLEAEINEAEVCVFVNKGHRLDILKKVGTQKLKILFHCLDFDEDTGGGTLDTFELRKKGFNSVYYPLNEDRFNNNIINYLKRIKLNLIQISRDDYKHLQHSIDGFTPNTGFATFWILSRVRNINLYVHGLTFMRTEYNSEYNLQNIAVVKEIIEHYGNHNPDLDFLVFRSVIKSKPNIRISMAMQSIVNRPYEPMFYLNAK